MSMVDVPLKFGQRPLLFDVIPKPDNKLQAVMNIIKLPGVKRAGRSLGAR